MRLYHKNGVVKTTLSAKLVGKRFFKIELTPQEVHELLSSPRAEAILKRLAGHLQ